MYGSQMNENKFKYTFVSALFDIIMYLNLVLFYSFYTYSLIDPSTI